MGCGASTSNDKSRAGDYTNSGTSGDAPEADDKPEPLTEEEARMFSEMDKRSQASTAKSADEPSQFRLNMRVSMKVMQARVLHGIDGTCEGKEEIDREDTAKPVLRDNERYGDLKPKQVKKLAEWMDRVIAANNGGYDDVPERYNPPKMMVASNNSQTKGDPGANDDAASVSSNVSTLYPPTPKGRADDEPFTPATAKSGGGVADVSVSDFSDSRRDYDGSTDVVGPPGFIPEASADADDDTRPAQASS